MMRRNVQLEARLIDDLLDLTRISRGTLQLQLEPTNVHSLLVHAEQIVRSDARAKQIKLQFELKASAHYVLADSGRLHQVFWNILKNAIKFTPAGGEIIVRTTNPGIGEIRLEFTDTGIGIESQFLGLVFDASCRQTRFRVLRPMGWGWECRFPKRSSNSTAGRSMSPVLGQAEARRSR